MCNVESYHRLAHTTDIRPGYCGYVCYVCAPLNNLNMGLCGLGCASPPSAVHIRQIITAIGARVHREL